MDVFTVELELERLISESSILTVLLALKDYCETQADAVSVDQGDIFWSVADRLAESVELIEEGE